MLGQRMKSENELSAIVVDLCLQIHSSLGPGLLESVYERVLEKSLNDRGLFVERQKAIPITFNGLVFDEGFRADLIVENKLLLELKSVEKLKAVHFKQVLTYIKLMDLKLGLLLNFGDKLMKDGIKRIVNGL